MKYLKCIIILLAIFCLTIATTSKKQETKLATDTIQQVDKSEYEYVASVIKKHTKPKQEI